MKPIALAFSLIRNDIVRQLEDNELVVDIVQKPIATDSLMANVAQSI
jgi:hypothetical protein